MDIRRYEVLDSPSELRLRIYGNSLADLFIHAVQAMFECCEPTFLKDAEESHRHVSLTASDRNSLLINFLADVVAMADIHNEAYFAVDFENIDDTNLSAIIKGKKVLRFALEIKAATHHEVHISEKNGHYSVDVILDI
jgi:SHS2 domain-containing protein